MEYITGAGNTEVPAYLALLHEGCRVERQSGADGNELWIAEQGELCVSGSSPVEVLGLYFMRKQHGADWKARDTEIEAFLKKFYSGTS